MKSSFASAPVERKTVEKNRRLHMKTLCFKLSSLIPKAAVSKDSLTQQDHLDQAATYIKTLKERIDRLKQKKELVIDGSIEGGRIAAPSNPGTDSGPTFGLRLPLVEIRALESTIEVVLICVPERRTLFYDVITVLEEEGADVINASFSSVNDKIFYTVHAQVRCPRIGMEASRLSERLRLLVRHD